MFPHFPHHPAFKGKYAILLYFVNSVFTKETHNTFISLEIFSRSYYTLSQRSPGSTEPLVLSGSIIWSYLQYVSLAFLTYMYIFMENMVMTFEFTLFHPNMVHTTHTEVLGLYLNLTWYFPLITGAYRFLKEQLCIVNH